MNELTFKTLTIRYEKNAHYVFDAEGTHVFINDFKNDINTIHIDDDYFIVIYKTYILLCSSENGLIKFEAIYPLNTNTNNSDIYMYKANKSYLCITYHPKEYNPSIINVMKNDKIDLKYKKIKKNNYLFLYEFDLNDISFGNSYTFFDAFNGGIIHSLCNNNILKTINHYTGKIKNEYDLNEYEDINNDSNKNIV